MSRSALAKLNLSLRVLAREATGMHSIETVFCCIELADSLDAIRTDSGVTIDVHGADVGPPADNLAVRAAEMVLQSTGRRFGVHLTLRKQIPASAGLGGGSSDAAAALIAVNAVAGNAVPRSELLQFAARLGSDVPFFVGEAPLALAWGHGERLYRLPPLPRRPVLIGVPREGVSTPDAYRWWDESYPGGSPRGAAALDLDVFATWGSIARAGANDFESIVFGRRPDIRALFEKMTTTRPLLCRLTGSGAAVFGIYRSERDRDDAALQMGERDWGLLKTSTCGL